MYTADLLMLASRRAISPPPTVSGWGHIQSPMVADVWAAHLALISWYRVSRNALELASGMDHPHATAHQLYDIG